MDGVASRPEHDVSVLRQAVVAAGQEQNAHVCTRPGNAERAQPRDVP
jgi:hypothetical protein